MSTLYVVATPIGNLSDASARSIEILGAVDGILAEDTRRTRKLLARFDLPTALTSLHEHNEASRTPRVVARLDAGEGLVLKDADALADYFDDVTARGRQRYEDRKNAE